jgi:iron complex transport system ATP-binding protein
MDVPLVDIQDLGFSYGEAMVLHDLSMQVRERRVLAIVGPNAAGKTTLLRCLERVLRPTTGVVRIDGRDTRSLSARELSRNLAAVPQAHAPVFPYTVQEVVLMGRNPHVSVGSVPSPKDGEKAREALAALGMLEMAERPYTRLSGGQLQLVLLARALAQEARVLVLDEPTAHLDFRNRYVVLDQIHRLATVRALAVVMTVHDPNDAMQYADRVGLLCEGGLVATGTAEEVLTAGRLQNCTICPSRC